MVTAKVASEAAGEGAAPGDPGHALAGAFGTVRVREAGLGDDLEEVRALFREYAAALDALGAATCTRGLDRERRGLPGEYGAPRGRMLLAEDHRPGVPPRSAGVVAVRPLTTETCEMKRLYVRPIFRAAGTGRALTVAAIAVAEAMGYDRIVLDTLPAMTHAIALYRDLGFHPIARYNDNPDPGTLFLARALRSLT